MNGPFFVAPHKPESEGVDYLGLRALNLSMMDNLLPGINNVVSLVRGFSLMAWVAWRHEAAVAGQAQIPVAGFKAFKEKVETLFIYSHVLASDAEGIPGNRQAKPASDSAIVFQFNSFKRTGSLLDAALYGPALKNINGLGFIGVERGVARPTAPGTQLAQALDASLRDHLDEQQYAFLAALMELEAPMGLVDPSFHRAWSAATPSATEQEVFASRLYQPERIGEPSSHGRRSTMLRYVLATLADARTPLSVADLRRRCTYEFPAALTHEAHAQAFKSVQRHWQLLQVRQAQRLGLEALFGWVERCLVHGNASSVEDILEMTLVELGVDGPERDAAYLPETLAEVRARGPALDGLVSAAAEEATFDILQQCDELETALQDRGRKGSIVRLAVPLLLRCAVFGQALREDPLTSRSVAQGPAFRLPLAAWTDFVFHHERQALSRLLRKALEVYVVSQHLGIAAARSGDEKSRMRLSIEDRGLTSLLPSAAKVLRPVRTADRLGSAMALMADCGLVRSSLAAAPFGDG